MSSRFVDEEKNALEEERTAGETPRKRESRTGFAQCVIFFRFD